ncbi:MAG: bifunctional metallophosphatase/5'-nucleotidase [Acholeplasmataceae bacterium]|nr:bifunctional metallophosphatase/5'-nucleotidase [Acholeplasmataceae bacterium]
MRKLHTLIVLIAMLLFSCASNNTPPPDDHDEEEITHLNIFYLNDTHGAVLENGDEMGMAKIGNLILDEKTRNPDNTLFITGGDILQGSLVSNYFNGASMMDTLNLIGLDAFVLGNHEFDWGLDVIQNYFNPETEGLKVEFPLLGANVFFKDTTERPDFVEPYTVIQKGQVKVGIIGLMGYGLESSIATSRVEDYEFGDPITQASFYAEHLRVQEEVDIVLVVIHGANASVNQTIGNFSGNKRVDAVFNGHSHSTYTQFTVRDGVDMPILQSGSKGSLVGNMRLNLDESNHVSGYSVSNLNRLNETRLNHANLEVDDLIQNYVTVVAPLLNEVIMISGEYMSRNALTTFMAKLIRHASDSDIAFHNSGGTTASINNQQEITIATLYQVFPFDNKIKTVYLSGETINGLLGDSYYQYHDIKDGVTFQSGQFYKVATNDYVFDYVDGVFIHGDDIVDTGILIRDILETVIRNQAEIYDYFMLSNPIVLASNPFTWQQETTAFLYQLI